MEKKRETTRGEIVITVIAERAFDITITVAGGRVSPRRIKRARGGVKVKMTQGRTSLRRAHGGGKAMTTRRRIRPHQSIAGEGGAPIVIGNPRAHPAAEHLLRFPPRLK